MLKYQRELNAVVLGIALGTLVAVILSGIGVGAVVLGCTTTAITTASALVLTESKLPH
jgi:hypothetical protein